MSRNAFLGLKRVFFDRIIERSYWIWRNRPAIMMPSRLQAALSLILQSVVTLAVMLLLINGPANPQLALLLASILSPNSRLVGVLLNPAFWLTNIPLSTAVVVTLLLVAVLGRLGVLFRVRNIPRGLEQRERPNVFGFIQWLQKMEVNGVDPAAVEPRYLGSSVDRVLVDNSLSCERKRFCRIGCSPSGL